MPRPSSTTVTVLSGCIVDLDLVAVSGQRLVDRVVDDLVDEVVQTPRTGGADVHAGAAADGLESLEDRDVLCVISALLVGAPCGAIVKCQRSSDDIETPRIHATWRAPRGVENYVHNDSTARGGNGVCPNRVLPANSQKRSDLARLGQGVFSACVGLCSAPLRGRPIAPRDRLLRTRCSTFVRFGRCLREGLPARRRRRTQDESRTRHRTTAQDVLSPVGGAGPCPQRTAGLGAERPHHCRRRRALPRPGPWPAAARQSASARGGRSRSRSRSLSAASFISTSVAAPTRSRSAISRSCSG